MSNKKRRVLLLVLIVLAISVCTLGYGVVRKRKPAPFPKRPTASAFKAQAQDKNKSTASPQRNLSLQPQAFTLSRHLGARFSSRKQGTSAMSGVLTIGSEQKSFQINRKQTNDGEQIEITFSGESKLLTWDATTGAKASGTRADDADRILIERLLLDTPDQFILAQLRGASYYTIMRSGRMPDSKDNETLYDIVRVNDPEKDESKRPQSRWRLYYLNTNTGLIDRIESQAQGLRVIAQISWTEVNGEKVPARITWTRGGTTLMQYTLSAFSQSAQ